MRLKVRLVGVPPWLVPNRVSPWAMALIVAAAWPARWQVLGAIRTEGQPPA